jgi:SHS2 domain-containing protein
MRYCFPQPFDELDHSADVGVLVRGMTADEALARLVLAFAHVVTGGGQLTAMTEIVVKTGPGDLAAVAVDVLRELLYRFDRDGYVPASCEVRCFDESEGAEVVIGVTPYDPVAHEEGIDVKSITWHEARFEREGDDWLAQVVLDV